MARRESDLRYGDITIWLRCSDCGYENAERPFPYRGELAAGGGLLPYRLGWWVTRCMNSGHNACPTRPVLTASPETVDVWLAKEPSRDDWQAHEAWMRDHPFTVEFRQEGNVQ